MIMTYSSYRVKVPGKLMIAGEYAVLETNQPAVVLAVDRYVSAYIEPDSQNQLSLPQLGLKSVTWKTSDDHVQFSPSDSRLRFIQNSILVVNQLLKEKSIALRPFHLTIKSELNDPETGKKYGLGSSAAVVVAVVSAILSLYGDGEKTPSLDHIFKLSAIAHLRTQTNGSGADIAAAVYGGWLGYTSYNPDWVLKNIEQGEKLTTLLEKHWPLLSIRPLVAPSSLQLAVGWTKEAVSTGPMIKRVQDYRLCHEEGYSEFLKESSRSVIGLINSFERNNCSSAISFLKQNRSALAKLSESADLPIETAKLKALCTIAEKYGSGKLSGAGGGDCGIAFLQEEAHIQDLHEAWKAADISPLKVKISKKGVSVTEYNCEPSLKEWPACYHQEQIRETWNHKENISV
jgi:phosphomevalonate kinase